MNHCCGSDLVFNPPSSLEIFSPFQPTFLLSVKSLLANLSDQELFFVRPCIITENPIVPWKLHSPASHSFRTSIPEICRKFVSTNRKRKRATMTSRPPKNLGQFRSNTENRVAEGEKGRSQKNLHSPRPTLHSKFGLDRTAAGPSSRTEIGLGFISGFAAALTPSSTAAKWSSLQSWIWTNSQSFSVRGCRPSF